MSSGRIARAKRVRVAYKVVDRTDKRGVFKPQHFDRKVRYRVGKIAVADKGPWADGKMRAEHGIYVFHKLNEAKYHSWGGAYVLKVRVKGFRHTADRAEVSTYDSVTPLAWWEWEDGKWVTT